MLGPIVIDRAPRAFDDPHSCGYKLLYEDLEQYVEALSRPSWHQWLNYETESLDKPAVVDMIQQSMDFVIDRREATGFYGSAEAYYEHCRVEADRAVVEAIDELMKIEDPAEREAKIVRVRLNLDQLEKTRMTFLE